MPVENFLKYKGKCYDIGTRLRFYHDGLWPWSETLEGVIEEFINGKIIIKATNGFEYSLSPMIMDLDKFIVEIINPVYYNQPEQIQLVNNRNVPPAWDVEIGWIWYIIIMIVGTIFNDRLIIWIVASAVFFLWKAGKLGGKK